MNLEDKMVDNNLNGKEFEKNGNVKKAIKLYSFNVQHRFQGNFPYDRLAIIYRKTKQYDKEIEVLEKAIDVFENDVYEFRGDREPKLDKFRQRLVKARNLRDKGK